VISDPGWLSDRRAPGGWSDRTAHQELWCSLEEAVTLSWRGSDIMPCDASDNGSELCLVSSALGGTSLVSMARSSLACE